MVEPHAVLEVSDGILDLGVAAMVGLQFQGLSIPIGDESVIAVVGEEGQLGTGRGLHPAYDEPHRRGVGLTVEGGVASTTVADLTGGVCNGIVGLWLGGAVSTATRTG